LTFYPPMMPGVLRNRAREFAVYFENSASVSSINFYFTNISK
jgi:hypothetical protein